jgi:hypothetical protein
MIFSAIYMVDHQWLIQLILFYLEALPHLCVEEILNSSTIKQGQFFGLLMHSLKVK